MPESRRRAWLKDELILALDLYKREGPSAPRPSIEALSDVLRRIPIEEELAADRRFRSPGSVARKLANFLAVDSGFREGLPHTSQGDGEVWDEFASDPAKLSGVAVAIRANLEAIDNSPDEVDFADAEEGRLLTRLHLTRERNRRLVTRKKAEILSREGRLACVACGFDFQHVYGERGEGFIECHHVAPLATLRPGQVTRLTDLTLLCSNCHRMIHRRAPWLTVEELRRIILTNGPVATR